jgi:hypothetical protein
MEFLHTVAANMLQPAILFFLLGIAAGFFKSDLEVPESISRYLSIYLMMAIGLKGGAAIAEINGVTWQMLGVFAAGLGFGFLQPFLGYALLKLTTRIDSATAAAVAAHYGSISIVTFATAASFLDTQGLSYAGYLVAVLALMEAPAILSGLFIAHRAAPETTTHKAEEKKLAREIFTNGAILLLLGSFVIGALTGPEGLQKVSGFLVTPFQGILALFLLDMGLLVSRNLHELKHFTLPLVAFAIYMPLASAAAGLGVSGFLGLDAPNGLLLTVLFASASYIAVPAAMRLALPEAKAAIYVPMSLGITFPFNILLGVPLYYQMSIRWLG